MVLVVDKHKKPCNTISEAYARILLFKKQAVIHKRFPFTIRLKNDNAVLKDRAYTVKLDPGSRHTGIAITDNEDSVVMLAEIEHRGHVIKKNLGKRRAVRNSRRQRKTRYRAARFLNRTKPEGWLAPSVKSRADNVINFIKVMIESVSFDVSQMTADNNLVGTNYQQGPLYDTNLRAFVFSKTNGKCSYCGAKAEEIDHIVPKSVKGFQTGDMVKAVVPKGLNKGEHLGRVVIHSRGYFDIKTKNGLAQGIGFEYCHIIQRSDGYSYNYKECDFLSNMLASALQAKRSKK